MRRYRRVLFVFIISMGFLTLFSNTIYRSLTPNVLTDPITGGYLSYHFYPDSFEMKSDNEQAIALNVRLPEMLVVSEVFQKTGAYVTAGTPILSFSSEYALMSIQSAQEQLERAKVALACFEAEYIQELERMQELLCLSSDEMSYISLHKINELLSQGIYNGQSFSTLNDEVVTLSETLDVLIDLKESDWTVNAPYDGWISMIHVAESEKYDGVGRIYSIIPSDSLPLIALRIENFPTDYLSGEWKITCNIPSQYRRYDVDICSVTVLENRKAEILLAVSDASVVEMIKRIEICVQSGYYGMLLPNTAIEEKQCYVLRERYGVWGEKEYYVEKVALVTGASDSKYTEIRSGISSDDRVVIMSSKELSSGITVVQAIR